MAWIDDIFTEIDTIVPSSPSDRITSAELRLPVKNSFQIVYDNFPTGVAFQVYPQARVSATGNISSRSGVQTLDGILTAVDDIVVLPFQTAKATNGPWQVKSGSWIRPTWFDSSDEVTHGLCLTKEGDTQAYYAWGFNPVDSFVLGTSDLNVVLAIDFSLEVYADLPDRGYETITLAAATWTDLPTAGDFKRYVCTFFDIDGANNEEQTSVVQYRYNTTDEVMQAYCEEAWTGVVYMIGITST